MAGARAEAGPATAWHGGATTSDARTETLWFFDADFEDLTGDNAGWQSFDLTRSNVGGDYWHKDTIRIRHFTHLGDSTWWCGRYHNWWRQPRGYGNNWAQLLYRELPLSDWSDTDDTVTLEWDQRFAMENDYDYGYVDFSYDTGASWTTLGVYANNGFAGHPGMSQDWDSVMHGHPSIDLSEFAGLDILVRYRFESDEAYSSQDQYNNPPFNSVLDGAWQLDNFDLKVNNITVWSDDCESPGENGWIHHHALIVGATGVRFERTFEPDTYGGFSCDPGSGWMMAAVDSVTGRMVDDQRSLLMTPPIDVSGLDGVIVQWDMWYDLAYDSGDRFWWGVGQSDTCSGLDQQAIFRPPGTMYEWFLSVGGHMEGPGWTTITYDLWSKYTSRGCLALGWSLWGYDPVPPDVHTPGAFLERVRLGARTGDPPTLWRLDPAELWPDCFSVDYVETKNLLIKVSDGDGLQAVRCVASDDSGQAWHSYDLNEGDNDDWRCFPPPDLLAPATQVLYYFEATDSLGNTSVYPERAPEEHFEFTILPIHGSLADPGILVVDKRRAKTPGDSRRYERESEYYLTEALDIRGFEYDVYDATGGHDICGWDAAYGPFHDEAYAFYDTHIWLTGDMIRWTLQGSYDQTNLIDWLSASTPESTHRLFLYGNNIGWDLIEKGNERYGFFTDWLGASYEDYHAGAYSRFDVPDTTIRVRDAGLGLMTHDDGECRLRCACPDLQYLDVVSSAPGGVAQVALEYVNGLGEVRPAGVVKVDSLTGYRIVYLPFGIELMNDGLDGTGHYVNGIEDRVDLIGNVMEFLGESPTAPGTGTPDASAFVNRLTHARPNPFNPVTTIDYSLATGGRATIRVFDAAGRVVRTLVNSPVEAGPHTAVWDGTTDTGNRAASGVYFVKMETAGHAGAFRATRKLVLLK